MSNLVDEEAWNIAADKCVADKKASMYDFLQAYETAKLEKQKNAYADDREASLPKQPLPELPEITEYLSLGGESFIETLTRQAQNNFIAAHIHTLYSKQNQILTYLEALNKRMGGGL